MSANGCRCDIKHRRDSCSVCGRTFCEGCQPDPITRTCRDCASAIAQGRWEPWMRGSIQPSRF